MLNKGMKYSGLSFLIYLVTSYVLEISLNFLDDIFGTSLVKKVFVEKRFYVENPKDPSEHILHSTNVISGRDFNESYFKDSVLEHLQKLQSHPLLKYCLYVNSINSARIQILDYKYTSSRFPLLPTITFYDDSYYGSHVKNYTKDSFGKHIYIEYYPELIDQGNMSLLKDALTSNIVKAAYSSVYQNEAKPYTEDSVEPDRYAKLVENVGNNEKNDYSNISKAELITNFAIAAIENNEVDIENEFPGVKDFYLKYSVPDFVSYVQQSLSCVDIAFESNISCLYMDYFESPESF